MTSIKTYFKGNFSEKAVKAKLRADPITNENFSDFPLETLRSIDFDDAVTLEIFTGTSLSNLMEQAYFNRLNQQIKSLKIRYINSGSAHEEDNSKKEGEPDVHKDK